jgi:hypothetical protein
MKFLRSFAKYILSHHKTSEEIRKLTVKNLDEIIVDYRCKRMQHLKKEQYVHTKA